MEILKGYDAHVKFAVPTDLGGATYQVFKEDVAVGGAGMATIINGTASCKVPYAATSTDGLIKVVLTFTYESVTYNEEKVVTVATPLLDLYEVKAILADEGQNVNEITDDEARAAEAGARHIINAHTGQSFGKFIGKISVTGSGEPQLRMPRRLISYLDINGNTYWTDALAIRGGGWYLQAKSYGGVPPVRADFFGYNEATVGVITPPPFRDYAGFVTHSEYLINGVWGWSEVPEAVREAARLLINDYACGDSLYRDRFITSMTAADWRLQFHDGAFANTGNVRANQLLGEFVLRRGWVVI